MGSEGRRTVRVPRAVPVCPACGQTVGTVIERHKVMGAWVPVWVARPCHNPKCELFEQPPEGHLGEAHEDEVQDEAQDEVQGEAQGEPDTPSSPGTTDKTGRSPADG